MQKNFNITASDLYIQVTFKNALFSWGTADFIAVAQATDCSWSSLYLFWLYFFCFVFVSEGVLCAFLWFEKFTCSNIWFHVRDFPVGHMYLSCLSGIMNYGFAFGNYLHIIKIDRTHGVRDIR